MQPVETSRHLQFIVQLTVTTAASKHSIVVPATSRHGTSGLDESVQGYFPGVSALHVYVLLIAIERRLEEDAEPCCSVAEMLLASEVRWSTRSTGWPVGSHAKLEPPLRPCSTNAPPTPVTKMR